jgi:uncharacterized protein YerC
MSARIKVNRGEFLRLNSEGWSITRLAAHFGVNEATISRLRRQHGAGMDARRMMTPERREVIQEMLNDGWPYREIRRTEGVAMDTLRKHFPGQAWTQEQANQFRADTRPARRKLAA